RTRPDGFDTGASVYSSTTVRASSSRCRTREASRTDNAPRLILAEAALLGAVWSAPPPPREAMGCASRRTLDGTNGRDERPGLHRLLSIRNSTPHLSRPTANEISTRPEDGRTAQASPGEADRLCSSTARLSDQVPVDDHFSGGGAQGNLGGLEGREALAGRDVAAGQQDPGCV